MDTYYRIRKHFEKFNNNYNWENWCSLCLGSFWEEEKFVRVDIQKTIMRWDDEVVCFHNDCLEEWFTKLQNNN